MTSILLIVVLVLLILCPLLLKKNKGARNGVVLVLLIAAAGLVIFNTLNLTEPKPEPGTQSYLIHEVAMSRLGEILAGDFESGGKVIVFQMVEESDGIRKSNAAEMAGLRSGTGSFAFDFVSVKPPAEDAGMSTPMSGPSGEGILKIIAEHAGAAAVVTCIDLPLGEMGGEALPPIYVFDARGTRFWKDALTEGAVKAAIVARESGPTDLTADMDPATIFQATYEVKRAAGG